MTLLSLAAGPAAALGLGRVAAQSSLGEPLRIEIEVSSITPEEASSLQVRIAGPEAYQKAGVEYNPILSSARAVLQRRPDGRTVLRLVSDRIVQEPFVELILDLAWPSGHLVRSYTLLIDPPATRTAAANDSAIPPVAPGVNAALSSAPLTRAPAVRPAPLPAPIAPPLRRAAAAPAPTQSGMVPPPASEFEPRVEAQPAPSARLAGVRPAEAAAAGPSAGADRYRVRPGDTLAAIAGRMRPSGVSLDQMLASLYRANSGAFIGNSIHRLRSGVVLNVPSADEVRALAPQQARQTLQAQSADFNAYRRGLAGAARDDRPEDASRRASGSLQAAVDDRKRAAASSPDRLTLSKDANPAASFNDALASLQRERQDAEVRLSALMRNIEELKALAGQSAASAAVASPAASQPVLSPRPLATASEPTVGVVPAASAPVVLTPPLSAASAGLPGDPLAMPPLPTPAPVAPAPMVAPPRMLPAESPPEPDSFLASLIEESALPLALAALLLTGALLYGARQLRKRRAGTQSETSFLDSSLKVDSFLARGDNLPPDSRQMPVGSLSSGYSLSQLDAGGDVDPVAEADVYLAYGRDLQAEEILKDAMRSDPDRLAIRTKLLEVYAKRRDTNGFEVLASQLHALTLGQGDDWELAQQLGRGIDAGNPLYAPGGTPRRDEVDFDGADDPMGPNTLPQVVLMGEGAGELDGDSPVDIEIDFDLDEPAAVQPSLRLASEQPAELPPLDFSPAAFSSAGLRPEVKATAAATAVTLGSSAADAREVPREAPPDLLGLDLLDLPVAPAAATPPPGAGPSREDRAGAVDDTPDLLDLDLLDFAATPTVVTSASPSAGTAFPAASAGAADDATPDLLDLDQLDLPASATLAKPSTPAVPAASANDLSLDFDLSSISLDLDSAADVPTAASAAAPQLGGLGTGDIDFFAPADAAEPVQRKLDLAEELLQLGDSEGARDLLNEVLGQTDGAQKRRAEGLLAQLP